MERLGTFDLDNLFREGVREESVGSPLGVTSFCCCTFLICFFVLRSSNSPSCYLCENHIDHNYICSYVVLYIRITVKNCEKNAKKLREKLREKLNQLYHDILFKNNFTIFILDFSRSFLLLLRQVYYFLCINLTVISEFY